jgi:hypothetical protein
MGTRVGIGRSLSRDSRAAGRELAEQALARLEDRAPSIVLLFSTMGYDQQALVEALWEATGRAPLVGCSAEGILSRHGSEEHSHAAVAAAIASDDVIFDRFFAPGFAEDSAACARSLARAIRESGRAATGGLLVVFADGISGNCRALIATLEAELPEGLTIIGGAAGDTLTFEKTCQFRDDLVASGGVSALLVQGGLSAEIAVTHGCRLIGAERQVTRTEGEFVCEIDGEPAWDFFKSFLPDGADSLEAMHVAHLLLAERLPTADPTFADFTVRVPIKLDPTRRALYFAAGISTGARVQLAIRDADAVCDRAIAAAKRMVERRSDERPFLVLQLDCAGRGALLFGGAATSRLIAPVQEVFGSDVPWIGLHTYGEIAPVAGKTIFHNYTAVLCALYPRPTP